MNTHKLVKLTFTATTIALAIITVYSANFYWGVYIAVRRLQLGIPQFDINISNASHAQVNIILTLENPSHYSFTLRLIQQRLYLDSEYIYASESSPKLQIAPQSTAQLPVVAAMPERKIPLVIHPEGKIWFLYITVILQGPLVGSFTLSNSTYLSA